MYCQPGELAVRSRTTYVFRHELPIVYFNTSVTFFIVRYTGRYLKHRAVLPLLLVFISIPGCIYSVLDALLRPAT